MHNITHSRFSALEDLGEETVDLEEITALREKIQLIPPPRGEPGRSKAMAQTGRPRSGLKDRTPLQDIATQDPSPNHHQDQGPGKSKGKTQTQNRNPTPHRPSRVEEFAPRPSSKSANPRGGLRIIQLNANPSEHHQQFDLSDDQPPPHLPQLSPSAKLESAPNLQTGSGVALGDCMQVEGGSSGMAPTISL